MLQEIQAYLSKEYSNLVTGDGNEEIKAQIRRFAGKYIQDNRIQVPGKTTDELIDAIYSEMAEFGFLTKYIYGEGIEEIDVNAWDDVEVQYSGGVTEKLKEHLKAPNMPSMSFGVCCMCLEWCWMMRVQAFWDI